MNVVDRIVERNRALWDMLDTSKSDDERRDAFRRAFDQAPDPRPTDTASACAADNESGERNG